MLLFSLLVVVEPTCVFLVHVEPGVLERGPGAIVRVGIAVVEELALRSFGLCLCHGNDLKMRV